MICGECCLFCALWLLCGLFRTARPIIAPTGVFVMQLDATRCDSMQPDATRCNSMPHNHNHNHNHIHNHKKDQNQRVTTQKKERGFFCGVWVGAPVKSKIVNNCARGLYTHFMFNLYAFGSRTERSGERLPKAAHGSVEARNTAVEQLLGSQINLRNLVVAVAERCKIRPLRS